MTPKMNILSCVLLKHIREQKIAYKMLKGEQEGERVNKELNEIESRVVHMRKKLVRYFSLLKTTKTDSYVTKKIDDKFYLFMCNVL